MTEQEKSEVGEEMDILWTLDHPYIVKYLRVSNNTSMSDTKRQLFSRWSTWKEDEFLTTSLKMEVSLLTQAPSDLQLSQITKWILEALAYLHQKKILHWDVKPENILVSEQGDVTSVKLIDFGLSCQVDTYKYMPDLKCGTMLYMAPEVFKKEEYSKTVDVWSLGITLFKIISGKHPLYRKGQTP